MAASEARERLRKIWAAWGLQPSETLSDKQMAALGAAEEWLDRGKEEPAVVIRAVQVLLADPERPGWKERPCWVALGSALADVWSNAGRGDDHMMYGQALLLAVWPPATSEGWLRLAPLLESAWAGVPGRARQEPQLRAWRTQIMVDAEKRVRPPFSAEAVPSIAEIPEASLSAGATKEQLAQWTQQNAWQAAVTFLNMLVDELGDRVIDLSRASANLSRDVGQLANAQKLANSASESDLLWWGQSRYCRALGKPYRRLPPDDVLWWASREAAHLSTSLDVEPAAAYLVETLHALGQDVFEKKPLRAWMEQLHATLTNPGAKPPAVSERLAKITAEDALGLPVTWVRLQASRNAGLADAAEAVWLNLDAEIDRGDWASWIFRESLLDLRLGQSE